MMKLTSYPALLKPETGIFLKKLQSSAKQYDDFSAFVLSVMSCFLINRLLLRQQQSDCDVDLLLLGYFQVYFLLQNQFGGNSASLKLCFPLPNATERQCNVTPSHED